MLLIFRQIVSIMLKVNARGKQQQDRSKFKRFAFIADTFRRNFGQMPTEFAFVRIRWRNIKGSLGIYVKHVANVQNRRAMHQVPILNIGRHAENRLVTDC